jgi:hypothetical protein
MTAKQAVIQGTYSDLKFIKSRNCAQVVVEIPLEAASDFVKAFGTPNPSAEIPVALARLATLVEVPEPKQIEARRGWQDMSLAQQAGIRSTDEEFWRFVSSRLVEPCLSSNVAASYIRGFCGVQSRSEFATDPVASEKWRQLDAEFYVWQRGGR